MRPPEHWHLRRRRSTRLWWLLALTGVLVIGAVALLSRSSGGEGDSSVISPECAVAGECAPHKNVDDESAVKDVARDHGISD